MWALYGLEFQVAFEIIVNPLACFCTAGTFGCEVVSLVFWNWKHVMYRGSFDPGGRAIFERRVCIIIFINR